jgi:hypothetical protein
VTPGPEPTDHPDAAARRTDTRKGSALPADPSAAAPDPEDWASAGKADDERYFRERPPHWE